MLWKAERIYSKPIVFYTSSKYTKNMIHPKLPDDVLKHIQKTVSSGQYFDDEQKAQAFQDQLIGYRYMQDAKDSKVKKFVEFKYGKDYAMQRYEYDEQLSAQLYLKSFDDEEIQDRAAMAWNNDFVMQKHECEKQQYAKQYMAAVSSKGAKEVAIDDAPEGDYVTQKYIYDELVYGDEK